jgi:hypothetical protein
VPDPATAKVIAVRLAQTAAQAQDHPGFNSLGLDMTIADWAPFVFRLAGLLPLFRFSRWPSTEAIPARKQKPRAMNIDRVARQSPRSPRAARGRRGLPLHLAVTTTTLRMPIVRLVCRKRGGSLRSD